MSFLEIRRLTRRYGAVTAVDGVDFDVREGEFVSLLGPSGCGKTTTLQMIAGFAPPDAGSIRLNGHDLTRMAPNRRQIGVVFQSYALFPHMTVGQNIAFGLEMRRVPKPEREARVRRALEQVHLANLIDRYPRQMSGGQQQRVALARALVIAPRLLLLDEPMSNLDAKLKEDMQFEIRRLQRDLGITTILVTHDQNEAMALSDRVAVMRAGQIMRIDTPQSAYEQPGSHFTSIFLGKSNSVAARRNGAGIILGDGLVLEASPAAEGLGERFICSLRPEKLSLCPAGAGRLDATVKSRIFLGNHWLFQLESRLGELLVFQQNIGMAVPAEGGLVGLDWSAENVVFLPGEAERG
jgi:putative spermidine/putrescine transport system ATP-binding protein